MSLADTAIGSGALPGIVRKREIETLGVPLSLRRIGAMDSPISVAGKEIHFAPTLRGPKYLADLEVVDPENRVVGALKAEGEARLQEFFVDGTRIREVLEKAATGRIDGVTDDQKAFLLAGGALDRIVARVLTAVDSLSVN